MAFLLPSSLLFPVLLLSPELICLLSPLCDPRSHFTLQVDAPPASLLPFCQSSPRRFRQRHICICESGCASHGISVLCLVDEGALSLLYLRTVSTNSCVPLSVIWNFTPPTCPCSTWPHPRRPVAWEGEAGRKSHLLCFH